jgi:hypothetical protein
MSQAKPVELTVYMTADVAELSRVLQMLVRQPMDVGRFDGDLTAGDYTQVSGLEDVREPIMRLTMTGSVTHHADIERASKALNRIVSVFKVIVTSS